MHTGPGRVELTAVLLSRAVRAENHRIEIGLEGVEGVVMLGHHGFREALEKRGPVLHAPGVRTASESRGEQCQLEFR
jgi:hypothetical protein